MTLNDLLVIGCTVCSHPISDRPYITNALAYILSRIIKDNQELRDLHEVNLNFSYLNCKLGGAPKTLVLFLTKYNAKYTQLAEEYVSGHVDNNLFNEDARVNVHTTKT